MSVKFQFEASTAEELLMRDSFTKLCRVPFPVEAARAPVVMHYSKSADDHTLVFLCNANIHQRRVTPPKPLRINGVTTRKYAVVPCSEFSAEEVENTIYLLQSGGYCAYTVAVNGKTQLYISWDEQCLAPLPEAPEEE